MAGLVSYLVSLFRGKIPSKHLVPIPKICHLVLTNEVVRDRPLFIIGDIHGCADELKELAGKAGKLHSNILFFFVGDLVNKGPKNKEVLDFVRSLDHYAVRGNHDDAVLKQCLNLRSEPVCDIPASYQWVTCFSDSDVDYLTQLPYTIEIPSFNMIIVHAGLVPGVSVENQDLTDMTHIRNVVTHNTLFGQKMMSSEDPNEGVSWASVWPGPEHVYFGHDARRGLQEHEFATGLDTGCLYGGCLTGKFINKCKTMIQVKSQAIHVIPGTKWK